MAYIYLILGFIFTFLILGMFIVNNFFPKLPPWIKIALVPILSVLTSTYLIYFVSLIIGFSRYSIILSFLTFCPWFIYYLIREFKIGTFWRFISSNFLQLIIGVCTFLLFFLALFPGIYTRHGGYIVMSSVNWQDTAMHQGIVESIAEGNFPPQAPYYAGTPLNYYYFSDFHSAILVNLFGRFFPRVIVYTNPLFAAIFTVTLYALAYEVTRKKKVAVVSSLMGIFFGSLMFTRFFADLWHLGFSRGLLFKLSGLLANNSYSMEYEKVFQMSSMGDYFLQNRPMMIGLPAITLVVLFLMRGFKKGKLSEILLSGIITGALIKFQYFGIVIGVVAFGLAFLASFTFKKLVFLFKAVFIFFLPIILISLPFIAQTTVNGSSIVKVVSDNFSFGPWERGKAWTWYLIFALTNFSLPFVLSLISLFDLKKFNRSRLFLILLFVVLGAIPFVTRFTVYKGDMFKFWYYMVIPMTILAPYLLYRVFGKTRLYLPAVAIFLFVVSFSSILTLTNSALNRNIAYTKDDLEAGLWIRANTPSKAVFMAVPTVHTPITQIGGRLRVLSYINWPYSHGYNTGEDNVFKRLGDVEKVYGSYDAEVVKKTAKDYNTDYLFLGKDEKEQFPEAETFLDRLTFLKTVYDQGGTKIYEIVK